MLRRREGMSIVEILVAVVLIAVGALAAIAAQRGGIKENQRSYSREVAAALARELLETVDSLRYQPASGTFNGCLNNTASATTYVTPCAAVSAGFRVDARGLSVASGGWTRDWSIQSSGGGTAATANSKTIRVRVQWVDRGQTQTLIIPSVKGWTYPAT